MRWTSAARSTACCVLVALLVAACGPGPEVTATRQPRDGRAGVHGTARIASARIAVSDGAADLTVGDCDPNDGADRDLCAVGTDVNGELFVLVVENPDVLVEGASIAVADPGCGRDCDDVADVAVVDVQSGVAPRLRARGGALELTTVEPLRRYAGSVRLELPRGELSADLDLVPLPD